MHWRIAFRLLIASLMVTPAAAEDPRAPVKLPPDVRAAFMEEMRHHMDSLDDVIAALAAADFAGAAKAARMELAIGGCKGSAGSCQSSFARWEWRCTAPPQTSPTSPRRCQQRRPALIGNAQWAP